MLSVWMLTTVATITTAAHRDLRSCIRRPTKETCSHTKNQVTLTHFTGFLGQHRKYLYVYYLCKLLICVYQICIVVAFRTIAPTDSLHVCLGDRTQSVKIQVWINHGGTNRNYCTRTILNYSKQPGNILCLSTFRLHVGSLRQDWLLVPVVSM